MYVSCARVFRGETNTVKLAEKCDVSQTGKSVCVYNLPLFGTLEKHIFMCEMFRGSFQLFFRGSNGQGVVSALFSGLKWPGGRFSPFLRGEMTRVSFQSCFYA